MDQEEKVREKTLEEGTDVPRHQVLSLLPESLKGVVSPGTSWHLGPVEL